ncbi:MAG: carboxypeptidase-like regulatory domain-containing protein [Lutibacter sp.]|nr:carboxypeptidase-like regulatory domain-containing protein [Lutibacter sp.]
MKKILISVLLFPLSIFAQEFLKGTISDKEGPVMGVSVYWLESAIGTTSLEDGSFKIPYDKDRSRLVISHIAYKKDTLDIQNNRPFTHTLKSLNELDEVIIASEQKTAFRSHLVTKNILSISRSELLKAACCNLAESFETSPSIDVHFADALTGSKQIKMLGLKSPYLLIVQENIPSIRGASQAYGLSFIPGTWVESIQITKGAGSVVNGFESISGQINAELVKPASDKRLFVNAFSNLNGRRELNLHINRLLNQQWATGLYVHGNIRNNKIDNNEDNFLDAPLSTQLNLMHRWQYTDTQKGWISLIDLRFVNDAKQTGSTDFDPDVHRGTTQYWGSEIDTRRYELVSKLGYVFPETPYQSIGLQSSYSHHRQSSYFGLKTYDIRHTNAYTKFAFKSIISDTRHTFSTGINAGYDRFEELVVEQPYNRTERFIGAFFEYAFDNLSNFSATLGIRADSHNTLGGFITPRLHLRYVPWENGVLKTSVGRGRRTANIFAENQALFGSNREIRVQETGGPVYGLNPETAWNYGASFQQRFRLFGKRGELTIDYYQTDFVNQVVVDWENPESISFYNVSHKSNAKSFQIVLQYAPFKNASLRTSYKYYDVHTAYTSGYLHKPLQASNRFFTNLAYTTPVEEKGGLWKFDTTYKWLGKQRLPDTNVYNNPYRLPTYSKGYGSVNAQITRVFSERFEWYVGGENMTNHRQENPVLGADNPFGNYFDTSIVYGPVLGAMYYTGIRFNMP